jgi:hypothetical protein
MINVPQDGVRTFLPPSHLAMTRPAITRPARRSYYTRENVRDLYLFPAEMKPTIQPMRIGEAKDFLVAQTVEQAELEGLPLSDLEKRMMYFTEGKEALEDPTALNDEFEAQYDTTKYEKKISRLMAHAYKRLRKENSEKAVLWDKAIRTIRKGDHYLSVLWGHPLRHNSPDRTVFVAIAIAAMMYLAIRFFLGTSRDGTSPYSQYFPNPNPHVMQALYVALFVVAIFFPRIILKPADKCFEIFDRLIGAEKKDDAAE